MKLKPIHQEVPKEMSNGSPVKVNEDERPTSDKAKVFIKMGAFRNMITHVLRFASESLDNSIEVLGMCIGKYESSNDTLFVENAIPVSHGSNIEVGFSTEDYAAFAEIDEKYAKEGRYVVGWYHSHPGWGLFFSDTDIKNHLGWQTDQNPHAIGIVFDHTLMGKDGNLGFEIYRLNDHTKGPATDYHKVKYEVEVPKTLNYFKWVQKFVEDSQKKNPILIKELREMREPAPQDLQEIPGAEKPEETEPEDPFPQITPIVTGFEDGMSNFKDVFMHTFKMQMGTWSKEVNKGAIQGTEFIKNTLNEMQEAISLGMSKVKGWFEKNMNAVTEDFKTDVSEYIDKRIEAQKELSAQIGTQKEEITNQVNSLLGEKVQSLLDTLETPISQISEKMKEITEGTTQLGNEIAKESETITQISSTVNQVSEAIPKNIEEKSAPLESEVIKDLEQLSVELNVLKDTSQKLKDASGQVQNLIKEFRDL